MKIRERKIKDLIRAEYNPRELTKEQENQLKDSLQRFGIVDPVIVNIHEDRKDIIIGGHQRTKVWESLGNDKIPTVELELTLEQEKELNVRLNKNTGQFDMEMLGEHFNTEDLMEWGFSDEELSFFEPDVVLEAEEDDYDVPDGGIETDIVLGDLFEIGEHRLLCGDSTNSDDVEKLMNGEKADMVFTDPPYNVDYGNIKHPKFKQRSIENDNMSGDEFKDFCQGFVSNIKLYCDGIVYCWAGPGKDGRIMFTILDENLHNSTMIIWNKDQFTLGRGKYQNKHECCWFGWNVSGSTFTDDRKLTNVWDFARPKKSELHPTMKPIEVVENGLNHSSKAGDKVLDLFGGSGSTMVASHQLKRRGYLMELDPKYCQVIVDRMMKLDDSLVVKRNGEPYKKKE